MILEKKFEDAATPLLQVEPSCTRCCSVALAGYTQGRAHVNTACTWITTLCIKCPCDVRHSRNRPQAATTPTRLRVSCIRMVANASAIVFLPLRKAPSKAGVTLKTKTGAWERDNVHELFKKATKCSGYQILNKAAFKANTSTAASIQIVH